MYELDEASFTTPNNRAARFLVRRGTNDWNVLNSILTADEYEVAGLELEGWALDLGAHIGGIAIALALDNPLLFVVAVEPVPGNAELIRLNADLNDVADRVMVREEAVGPPGTRTHVRFGFAGSELAEHHAFIGNAVFIVDGEPDCLFEQVEVGCVDLRALAYEALSPPVFVKVDCEGGEWAALDQIVSLGADRVVGEWHPIRIHTRDELARAFCDAGYTVELTGPEGGPGGFTALR
jgi:FkbM family methyltransferase